MDTRGFGQRINDAMLSYSARVGRRITLAQFGELVANAEEPPREAPYSPATVQAWIGERGEPGLKTFMALGKLLGQHPSVIAFGDAPDQQEQPKNYRRMEDVVAEQEALKTHERKPSPASQKARRVGGGR